MVSTQLNKQVQQACLKELNKMLANENHDPPNWKCIFDEIQCRQIQKIGEIPWWQHTINIILVLGAIAAVVGAYLTYLQMMPSNTYSSQPKILEKIK
ncbi:MAG: hypothetical protein V1685_07605 [Parcubacteria group bacterium]